MVNSKDWEGTGVKEAIKIIRDKNLTTGIMSLEEYGK